MTTSIPNYEQKVAHYYLIHYMWRKGVLYLFYTNNIKEFDLKRVRIVKITPAHIAQLAELVAEKIITKKQAKEVFIEMLQPSS